MEIVEILPGDEANKEADLLDRFKIVVDGEHGQAGKLRCKALRRVQDNDLLLVFEVEFFEDSSHSKG